jgi:hypothetical protein
MPHITRLGHYPVCMQAAVRTESLRPFAALNARLAAAMWRGHRQLSGEVPVAAPARCVPSGGSGRSHHAPTGGAFLGGCLLRALLVNCDLRHAFEEASCASIMKTKQEHAHAWVWSAFV